MAAGRRTSGVELVNALGGSSEAKRRLKLILKTLSGDTRVVDACKDLGVCEALFYRFRHDCLKQSLQSLEPKCMGRPRKDASVAAEELQRLEAQNEALRRRVEALEVREEIALSAPGLLSRTAEKKTRLKGR
jgi:transposase-like protein